MNVLKPIGYLSSAFNTISTAVVCAQLGLVAYRKVRELQKQVWETEKLKEQFILEYKNQFDREPTAEEISVALRCYNAVEHPYQQYCTDTYNTARDRLKQCVEGKWLEELFQPDDPNGQAFSEEECEIQSKKEKKCDKKKCKKS